MAVTADSEKEKEPVPHCRPLQDGGPHQALREHHRGYQRPYLAGRMKPGDILLSGGSWRSSSNSAYPGTGGPEDSGFLGVISYVPGKGMYVQPLEVPPGQQKIFLG